MSERRTPSTRRRRPPRRQSRLRLVFWLVIIASLAGVTYFGWKIVERNRLVEEDSELPPIAEETGEEPSGDRAVVLVFPEWDASGYVTEQRLIPSRDRADEDLLEMMKLLCGGPRISGAVSALPSGTRILGAFYDVQQGAAVLDFSQELVIGHPGGSAAESATLTSILRSVALNFPEARSCTILVDGAQVETLAGHLMLDRPLEVRRFL